jgi:putative zinc finger/helix-turn-helix YgiT family protein
MREVKLQLRPSEYECFNCGSNHIATRMVTETFQYGSGAKAAELQVSIPVRQCGECGFEYTDSEADDLRHETVCRHLGVMTPAEVVALRKRYNVSRAEFAERTRIGEASLARWETGELIQNAANDNYLYLLSFPENFQRVVERHGTQPVRKERLKETVQFTARFRSLVGAVIQEKRKEGYAFQL